MKKHQTVGPRIVAWIIDGFMLIPITLVGSLIGKIGAPSPWAIVLTAAFTGFGSVFYYILAHTFFGQTVGKYAAGVKVVNDDESLVNFNQAVLRSLPQLVPVMHATTFAAADAAHDDSAVIVGVLIYFVVITFYIFDVIFFLSDSEHRSLHDRIAKTVVINVKT